MKNAERQFTIRQSLGAVALGCIVLSLFVLLPRASVFIAAALAGLGLVTFGARRRHKSALVAGLLLATVGGGLLLFHGASVAKWVGRAELTVYVVVIDTDTFEPVESAIIEVLQGPSAPFEGPVLPGMMGSFRPDPSPAGTGPPVTNGSGRCEFKHKFFAAGSSGLFEESGYIDTRSYWLKASAPGRGSILIPMDRQSDYPRDINDRSPLLVTVPLPKRAND